MIRHLLLCPRSWSRSAVIEDDQSISYRDLMRKAVAIQKRLPQKQREIIAVFLPNSGDYIAALYATLMAGMVAFPLNVQLTMHEIAPLLAQTAVQTIITSVKFRAFFEGISGHINSSLQLIYTEELSKNGDESLPMIAIIGEEEPMILLHTSGTTGNAKIVQLSEKNVETAVFGFSAYNDFDKFDENKIKYILGTPFSSVYGLLILSACLLKSFPIVIPKEAVTLDILFRAAEKHNVTHYEGGATIPIIMDQMSNRTIPYNISSLRFIGFGGSKVTSDVLSRLSKAFPHIEVCPGYGSTESSSLIARPYKKMHPDRLDSVGTAIPRVTIMVEADGVIGNTPRTIGEVLVKGPNVMLGYYQNEAETLKIIKDGYLCTGDIGYLDEEGYLYLCGRKKNVIMVRGFSVYAEEVEACLLSSGLVKDCIVYGETDASGNELLCANIVPAAVSFQADELRLYCEGRLAGYKQPQKIQVVESIKKTATGKAERTK